MELNEYYCLERAEECDLRAKAARTVAEAEEWRQMAEDWRTAGAQPAKTPQSATSGRRLVG